MEEVSVDGPSSGPAAHCQFALHAPAKRFCGAKSPGPFGPMARQLGADVGYGCGVLVGVAVGVGVVVPVGVAVNKMQLPRPTSHDAPYTATQPKPHWPL